MRTRDKMADKDGGGRDLAESGSRMNRLWEDRREAESEERRGGPRATGSGCAEDTGGQFAAVGCPTLPMAAKASPRPVSPASPPSMPSSLSQPATTGPPCCHLLALPPFPASAASRESLSAASAHRQIGPSVSAFLWVCDCPAALSLSPRLAYGLFFLPPALVRPAAYCVAIAPSLASGTPA